LRDPTSIQVEGGEAGEQVVEDAESIRLRSGPMSTMTSLLISCGTAQGEHHGDLPAQGVSDQMHGPADRRRSPRRYGRPQQSAISM
jgi:hypothetical protein